MNDQNLRRRIAEVVSDSSRMLMSLHAIKQMRKRKVSPTQVLEALRTGYVFEHAHQNIKGNWQCTLAKLVAGNLIKVAAALVADSTGERVIVITVMN